MKHLNIIFRRILISLVALLVIQIYANATSINIKGRVCDKHDHEDLVGATIRVRALPDSAVILMDIARSRYIKNGESFTTSEFTISLPSNEKSYVLEFSHTGFQKQIVSLNSRDIAKTRSVELPLIELERNTRNLQEVTVEASNIKFYHKGDTVVFDANAFVLPSGSMLDALVKQLPGVELKNGGQIFYNGKYVQSLLLDGKAFFNGNNQLMLENLGAYTVKNIKIYDKQSDDSEFAGRKLTAEENLVMDVKLKKEFSQGLISNVQIGYGSDNHYLGRLFGMLFNHENRFTIYGNINNLNDNRKPGEKDSWSPSDLKTGILKTKKGGLDYYSETKKTGFRLNGNIQIEHTDLDDEKAIYQTNFLSGGNTYDRRFRASNNLNLKVSTNHNLYLKTNRFNLSIIPTFEYNNHKDKETESGATFDKEVTGLNLGILTGSKGTGLTSDYINHYVSEWLKEGNMWTGGMSANSNIKINSGAQILEIGANMNMKQFKDDNYQRYLLNYAHSQSDNLKLDRYFKNHPNCDSQIGTSLGIDNQLGEFGSITTSYRFKHSEMQSTSELFNLHELGEKNSPIGTLPSMSEYLKTKGINSYESNLRVNEHMIVPILIFGHKQISGQFVPSLKVQNRHINYESQMVAGGVSDFSKTNILFNIEDTFIKWKIDKFTSLQLYYYLESKAPEMVDYIDMINKVDPLNIYLGNSSLKNSLFHRVSLSGDKIFPKLMFGHQFKVAANIYDNALAKSLLYDETTGARTYRTENIDGNWSLEGMYCIQYMFGPKGAGTLQFAMLGNLVHSADLIGVKNILSKNIVMTKSIAPRFESSYRIGKHELGVNANIQYANYSGDGIKDSMNTVVHSYGVKGVLNPFASLQLSTDFNLFRYSGFADKELNRNNFVWNARLSYSVMNGSMLLMLDGFDILRNLTNVSYKVNAQARTETYLNVMPSYFMFNIQYKFNRQPKKQTNEIDFFDF